MSGWVLAGTCTPDSQSRERSACPARSVQSDPPAYPPGGPASRLIRPRVDPGRRGPCDPDPLPALAPAAVHLRSRRPRLEARLLRGTRRDRICMEISQKGDVLARCHLFPLPRSGARPNAGPIAERSDSAKCFLWIMTWLGSSCPLCLHGCGAHLDKKL